MPELRRFNPAETSISRHEAWCLFQFFWPGNTLGESDLTEADMSFAQGLLLEAIDASYQMGYAHIIYDAFYGKIPGSFSDVQKMVKRFIKNASRHWFRHLGSKQLSSAEVYVSVRNTIAIRFRPVLQSRVATGELMY